MSLPLFPSPWITDEHRMLQDSVARFYKERCVPRCAEWREAGMMGREHLRNLKLFPDVAVTALADPVVTSIDKALKTLGDTEVEARLHLLALVRRLLPQIDLLPEARSLAVAKDRGRWRLWLLTPEIPSLHLAREKLNFLTNLDLGDRVRVLLNRSHKRSVVTPEQIESLLGCPVMMSFANDYQGVHRALQAGRAVEPNTELGKQFRALSASILEKKVPEMDTRKRFVEYFSILPARYWMHQEGGK